MVGPLPPLPVAYGTRGQPGSGWLPSSTRSSTADRSRWRRRKAQTSPRSGCPGTRRTTGHPRHMASLPPGRERQNGSHKILCSIGGHYYFNLHSSFLGTELISANITSTYPFINLPMLQLNKSGTNGCNVALLIGEGHSSCPFWILEFGVCVNPSVAHSPIQTVHDHG